MHWEHSSWACWRSYTDYALITDMSCNIWRTVRTEISREYISNSPLPIALTYIFRTCCFSYPKGSRSWYNGLHSDQSQQLQNPFLNKYRKQKGMQILSKNLLSCLNSEIWLSQAQQDEVCSIFMLIQNRHRQWAVCGSCNSAASDGK